MLTTLTRSARRLMAEQHRRAESRALLEQGDRGVAEMGLDRGALAEALKEPRFESALDAAYRDSARLRATYALH